MRLGCEEGQRVAIGWRRKPGRHPEEQARQEGQELGRKVRQSTRLARRSARARHERAHSQNEQESRLAEKPNHESNSELSISVPMILQNPSRLNSADLIAEIPLSDWETAKIVADWVSE